MLNFSFHDEIKVHFFAQTGHGLHCVVCGIYSEPILNQARQFRNQGEIRDKSENMTFPDLTESSSSTMGGGNWGFAPLTSCKDKFLNLSNFNEKMLGCGEVPLARF